MRPLPAAGAHRGSYAGDVSPELAWRWTQSGEAVLVDVRSDEARASKLVYRRGTANLKRVLALGGAKNHLIVMPDADTEMASSNIVASMSGCAGQRCMAASVMVAVSDTDRIINRMVQLASAMVPAALS